MHAFDLPVAPLHEDESGVIRIVGSRVTLDSIVAVFDRGATPEEIVQSFPSVALPSVYAVLTYVVSRRAEVDVYLAQREEAESLALEDLEQVCSRLADIRDAATAPPQPEAPPSTAPP
jgi:uncharacterized protein (DUF433 family)